MTTAVTGLIKIGKTGTKNYQERMRNLEANGYYNVVGLKRIFAIELEDYSDKENLLHEIFAKHQVGSSELFALDEELVKQLLLSFEGDIVYPEKLNKIKEFDKVVKKRERAKNFSFYKKGLKNGDILQFIDDPNIEVKVVSENEVEYEGIRYATSTLVRKLRERMGTVSKSGSYQGPKFFKYKNKKVSDIPDNK